MAVAMSWLRWWDGTCNDPKWRVVSARSGQPVGNVIAVWAYLLEEARQHDGELPSIDIETISIALGYEPQAVEAIIAGMKAKGTVDDSGIVNWRKRQPKREDDSRSRVAAFRERKAFEKSVTLQQDDARNADVTHCNAPEAEAEAEKKQKDISSSLRSDDSARSPKPSPRQALLTVLTDEWAEAVLDHRQKLRKPLTAKAAEMLAKAFDATGDPNGAAEMMISRGWQGFKLDWWQNDRTNHGNSAAPPGYGGGAAFQPVSRRNRQEPPSVAEAIMRAGRQRAYPADVSGERADLSRRDGCNGERGGVTIDGAGSVILN